jgi:uncharacterized BrkB/YihY/UPF0761 family membrane protein
MADPEPGLVARVKKRLPQPDVWLAKLERARRRIPLLDAGVEVVERDAEIGGGILAGALAYRLFIFFLPFAFMLVAVLGLVADWTGSTPKEISKDVGLVGLVTSEIASTANGHYNIWVLLASLVVLAYSTRVLYRSVSIVHALAWNRSAAAAKTRWRPFRLFGLALMVELALALLLGAVRGHSFVDDVLALVGFVVLSAANWLCMSLLLPHSDANWTDLIPGAIVFGIGLLLVNTFNLYILGRLQEHRTSTYGTLGAAATVLLSLLLIGRLIVGSAVVNATLFHRRERVEAAEEAIG